MTMSNTTGRFVWHDLMASDVDAAKGFYSELFGWKLRPHGDVYTYVSLDGVDIGGIIKEPTVPTHWIGYITVGDVDQAEKKATEMGATAIVPPCEIPGGVGRFSVLADPQGAFISAIKLTNERAEDPSAAIPGAFCWDELLTNDFTGSLAFYRGVFGLGGKEVDVGAAIGRRSLLVRKRMDSNVESDAGGVMESRTGKTIGWVTYIAVEDVERSHERAERLKAKTIRPPFELPNVGRGSVLMDPQGASFALFRRTRA
jgi:predicted enzyme related to lactoylglutathione lyase